MMIRKWYVLDVMKQNRKRNSPWVALLIDIDPDVYRAGQVRAHSTWRPLGQHSSLDAAWDHAEELLQTRH